MKVLFVLLVSILVFSGCRTFENFDNLPEDDGGAKVFYEGSGDKVVSSDEDKGMKYSKEF
jgi:hypothetical protein